MKWMFDWMFAVGIHPEAKFSARVLALSSLCHMANVFKSGSGTLMYCTVHILYLFLRSHDLANK